MSFANTLKQKGKAAEEKFSCKGVEVTFDAEYQSWDNDAGRSVPVDESEIANVEGLSLKITMGVYGATWSKNWTGFVGLSDRGDRSGWIKYTQPSIDALGIDDIFELDGHYFDVEFPKKGRRYKTKDGEYVNAEVPVFTKYYGTDDPSRLMQDSETDIEAAAIDMDTPVDAGHASDDDNGISDFIAMMVGMGDSDNTRGALNSNPEVMEYLAAKNMTVDNLFNNGEKF